MFTFTTARSRLHSQWIQCILHTISGLYVSEHIQHTWSSSLSCILIDLYNADQALVNVNTYAYIRCKQACTHATWDGHVTYVDSCSCIYIYIYIYIYTYAYVNWNEHAYIYIYIYMHMSTELYVWMYTQPIYWSCIPHTYTYQDRIKSIWTHARSCALLHIQGLA
jgi:hypothetical protein